MRIQHVSIPIATGAAAAASARRFYGSLLGLEEMIPPVVLADLAVIWFRLGDTELHLLPEPLGGQDRSGRHFCIEVADVEALRATLEADGVAVVGASTIPGRPRYFIRDPFGNLIEFTTIDGDYLLLQNAAD